MIIAVVALILALLAAVAAGVLWYRGQQRLAELDSRVNTVEKGLQKNVQKVVMPKLADMRDNMQQQSQRIDQLAGTLDQRQQQINQLEQSLQHVQARNNQLSDQLGGNHERFVEQRIALLLEAANQRLQVERDPEGARRALELADEAIQRAGDPQLHSVRAKIADEIAALKALPNTDVEGLSLRLANVISQIPKLPLDSNVPSSYQNQRSGESSSEGSSQSQGQDGGFAGIRLSQKWHQFVDSVGNALTRMVTIRRANGTENAPALMAPDQAFFLTQNLQLQLRVARLALLDGNTQSYHDAIDEARGWIKRYFDTNNSQVASVLDELGQLSHVKLDWQAPDLSASLKTLRRIMARNQQAGGEPSGNSGESAPEGSNDANAAGSS